MNTTNVFWHKGANPTADLCLFAEHEGVPSILLIKRRDAEGVAERGKWALPGGFVETTAGKGEAWADGETESPSAAAGREASEEAGVEVDERRLTFVGVYEGGGRDPRDNEESWSRAHAFALLLDEEPTRIAAGDDAEDARMFPLTALPSLAFDHGRIAEDAARVMGLSKDLVEGRLRDRRAEENNGAAARPRETLGL